MAYTGLATCRGEKCSICLTRVRGVFNIQYSILNNEYVSLRDITLYNLMYRHTHLMNKSIGEFLVNSPKDL